MKTKVLKSSTVLLINKLNTLLSTSFRGRE
nr:MAG TPA: hypothetical protein [Caudoviricetes sp.]